MDEPIHKPSIEEASKLEFKTLSKHLKYAYLGLSKILSIIIASNLDQIQEEEFLVILKENKEATGWTMVDIKRINPSIIQHQIYLREKVKLIRDPKGDLTQLWRR